MAKIMLFKRNSLDINSLFDCVCQNIIELEDDEEVFNVSTICIQYTQLMIVLVMVITLSFKTSE